MALLRSLRPYRYVMQRISDCRVKGVKHTWYTPMHRRHDETVFSPATNRAPRLGVSLSVPLPVGAPERRSVTEPVTGTVSNVLNDRRNDSQKQQDPRRRTGGALRRPRLRHHPADQSPCSAHRQGRGQGRRLGSNLSVIDWQSRGRNKWNTYCIEREECVWMIPESKNTGEIG